MTVEKHLFTHSFPDNILFCCFHFAAISSLAIYVIFLF